MNDLVFNISLWETWTNLIRIIVICIGLGSAAGALLSFNLKSNTTTLAVILFIILLFLLGLFPIEWGHFTDRANYAYRFIEYKVGHLEININNGEVGYQIIQYVFSRFVNAKEFMFCMTFIYLTNYYIAFKKLVYKQIYWLFIVTVVSLGFLSYNLNTMRAGLALSFIVLGLSMYNHRIYLILCLIISASIHLSTAIPGIIILVCTFYRDTRLSFLLWIISIPVSYFAGRYFNFLFDGLGMDERSKYLTTIDTNYNIGFRIDFIVYSMIPMLVGAYYIFRKRFKDKFYEVIYNAYILTNIFWILVIRANFSDRFAYLSWFFIPFILAYPILVHNINLNSRLWLSMILLGETLFYFWV